jgi:hypothetical protein
MMGDDLPRRIDDKAAVFMAAHNSPHRCLQCGNPKANREPRFADPPGCTTLIRLDQYWESLALSSRR